MNIALLGYGKMGKSVELIAIERAHIVNLIIDHHNATSFTPEMLHGCDVAIEFSRPEAAVKNIETCIAAKVPVVCGTTGWLNVFSSIRQKVEDNNGTFLYASNFSIGVNLFFRLNALLSQLMSRHKEYAPSIVEEHHIHKLDSPSGTAITLAEQIIGESDLKKWSLDENGEEDTLHIKSLRNGENVGTHTVSYSSSIDSISIAHCAKNRKGFAIGAVLAAEFLHNKKGIYTMQDVLGL